MSQSFLIISALLFWHHQGLEAIECSIPNERKVRTFNTVQQFQGNKMTFNFMKGGWQGNDVEFVVNTIDRLPRNVFVTYDSSYIISMKLSRKQIQKVDEEAFFSLLCLRELYLDHNNITTLTSKVFETLQNLHKLDLSFNKLEILKDITFSALPKLEILNLGNNRIKNIEILAFANLTSLVYLDLEQNQITKVTNEVFVPLVNLTRLKLSWNKLSNIEPEKWNGLNKLLDLEVAGNSLDHFDPSYNFSFANLRNLDLSCNSLTMFNVLSLRRHLPHLVFVNFTNNPWFCDDLESIIHELSDSGIKYAASNSSIGVHGIECRTFKPFSRSTTDVVTTTSTPGRAPKEVWVNEKELERYVEEKIKDSDEKWKAAMESLRTFIIFVFCLLCLFILFEILYKSKICVPLFNRLQGGNELYVDDSSSIENYRLLHR